MQTLKLGVIADDFTGATDIASFMVNAGWRVIQLIGDPALYTFSDEDLKKQLQDIDAVVISLKSRSCDPKIAVSESLSCARWLKKQGAKQLFFKYCSTFDSTAKGNIGPVADALVNEFDFKSTIFCPGLPVNGRTVLHGHLFVNGVLLNESGMQNHPITPMRDANLMRVLQAQSQYSVGLINYQALDRVKSQANYSFDDLTQAQSEKGMRYYIVDSAHDGHLDTIAQLSEHLGLVTGGSGLAGAIAKHEMNKRKATDKCAQTDSIKPTGGRTIILSGSCSLMTNQQVKYYQSLNAPCYAIDVAKAINNPDYCSEIISWIVSQEGKLAPLVFATQSADDLAATQKAFGVQESSHAVESLFARIAHALKEKQFNNFIVAGGETSGSIIQSIGVRGFEIGESIAPGVPWVKEINQSRYFALKSGNFGNEQFFQLAQKSLH